MDWLVQFRSIINIPVSPKFPRNLLSNLVLKSNGSLLTTFLSGSTAVFSKNVERSKLLLLQPRRKKLNSSKSKRSLTNLMALIAPTLLIPLIAPLSPQELALLPELRELPELPPLLPPPRLVLQRMVPPMLDPKN